MKNKGFSLVEIIIAIAILAILASSAIVISGTHLGWRVNKAVKVMESSLDSAMVQSMSKANVKGVVFYQLNGKYYATTISEDCMEAGVYKLTEDKIVSKECFGTSPIEITVVYKAKDGSATQNVVLVDQTSETDMTVAAQFLFDKGSGAIQDVKVNNVDSVYSEIQIKCGDRSSTIVIYPTTGKHEMK